MGVVLHPDLCAEQVEIAQQVLQVECRVGIWPIDPDEDIFDDGGIAGLPQIR
ncbi:hypothetical protein D3C78_1556600 [compost metagenome]